MASRFKLKYWFEWGGSCLWAANETTCETFGNPIQSEILPLSQDTVSRIDKMANWHDTALNWEYPPGPGPWRQVECDKFNKAAIELYEQIQMELGPEFVVLNCQELLMEDPDLDEYLKDPMNFRRTEQTE